MWVMEFGTINGTSATGVVLAVIAAVVVGGVNIFGGSGTVIGAAIGAYFLGFVANALILVGLSQFWLQAIYGVVILVAVSADAPHRAPHPAHRRASRADDAPRRRAWRLARPRPRALGDAAARRPASGLIVLGTRCRRCSSRRATSRTCSPPSWRSRSWPLPMTLVIIAGEIDLSVESMAGLSCAVLGFLWAAGVPIWIAIALVLVIGALGGLLNGVLVARGGLPSLVVTLGTLALFRGLALIVLGPTASATSRRSSRRSVSATCPGRSSRGPS